MIVNEEECWKYQGICLYEPPEGYYGFTYKITDDKGGVYYGKKAFSHSKKRKLSKKERIGTRKRVETVKVDSKWLSYWGSCKALLLYISERGGTQGFRREIIQLCETKTQWTYSEIELLVLNDVLRDKNCWNSNILGRFYKGKV